MYIWREAAKGDFCWDGDGDDDDDDNNVVDDNGLMMMMLMTMLPMMN